MMSGESNPIVRLPKNDRWARHGQRSLRGASTGSNELSVTLVYSAVRTWELSGDTRREHCLWSQRECLTAESWEASFRR